MPKTQKVDQKSWTKGVNATAMPFAQPKGSFPRGSNLVYVRRGSLYTCDGSLIISMFNSIIQPVSANLGPITELFLYQPMGAGINYFLITKDYNTHLAVPTGLGVATGAAGVLNGVYKWEVTALDGVGGETTVSSEVTQTMTNQRASVTWTATPNAVGYNVYRTKVGGASGTELFSGAAPAGLTSYTDDVADGALGGPPPSSNTTQVCQFYLVPITSYGIANLIHTFPADNIINQGPGSGRGGYGGSGGGTSQGNNPPYPAGGIVGNLSSIPQIIQFNDLMILILGNGNSPYSSDGTTGNTTALTNTFQAVYPTWAASTPQNAGDLLSVTIGGTLYTFKCIQAGTTGTGGAPAFSATLNSTVADGTVIWQNIGPLPTSIPPRGAAHGIVYAGSLWVGNTYPTTTPDNFDGPSCLKMSDLNNPDSWNPLNVAFLDRDDGTQISGMAAFTIAESGIPPVGSLVVFKDFSTFQINGVFGASDFAIQRAQTDMGCSAARTIQFVPGFGIVRLTHLGFAVFDGVRDRLLSEEIRPYIFGGQADIAAVDWNYVYFCKGTQTAQPPMYTCAVPLVPNNAPLNVVGLTAASGAQAGVTLTPGSYYVKLQAVFGNGSTQISTELGPVTVNSTHGIGIDVYPIPTGLYKWRVFFGIGSGNETQYQDFAPATSLFISAPGNAGVPTSSNGALTRILSFDMVLKAWTIIDLPFPISVFKQFRTGGSIPITLMGGFTDGAVRRWLGGAGLDSQWDIGATNAGAPDLNVRASVRSPEVFGKNASDRTYFREVAIRGVGSPSSLTATVVTSGTTGNTIQTINFTVIPMGNGEFVAYADIGVTAVDAYVTLNWTGPMEMQSIDWYAVPKATRARVAV